MRGQPDKSIGLICIPSFDPGAVFLPLSFILTEIFDECSENPSLVSDLFA